MDPPQTVASHDQIFTPVGTAITIEAKDAISPNPFPGYIPGYVQFSFEVPEGTKTITLSFEVAAVSAVPQATRYSSRSPTRNGAAIGLVAAGFAAGGRL